MNHRSVARRDLLWLGVVVAVPGLATACGSLLPSPGENPQIYVLRGEPDFAPDLPTVARQLLVDRPQAPAEIDTTRIALSRSPAEITYFADAAWSDRAPLVIQSRLIEGFEASRKIQAVSDDIAILRADYLLLSDLRRFQAVYETENGTPSVQIRILGRLVRASDRTILGERVAESRVAAARNKMDAIVAAFDQALVEVTRETVEWSLRLMSETAGTA